MKTLTLKRAAATALLLIVMPVTHADEWTGRVAGAIGAKHLDENDWNSLDSQAEGGVLFDIKKKGWPVSIAIDLFLSGDDASKSDPQIDFGDTVELHVGLRKTWSAENSKIHRYVGGGLAHVRGGMELLESAGGTEQSDNAVGGWVSAGAYWDLTDKFNIGFDVRYSQAEVTILDREIDAGGIHNMLTLGYSF